MRKCLCCKFDNCKAEFIKHRSNTSFSAVDIQFTTVAKFIESPQDFTEQVCEKHSEMIKVWLNSVFEFYDSLKVGVNLVKMR